MTKNDTLIDKRLKEISWQNNHEGISIYDGILASSMGVIKFNRWSG